MNQSVPFIGRSAGIGESEVYVKQLFIPAKNRGQAEQEAPGWACRFARVTGGFIAFDSQAALDDWQACQVTSSPAGGRRSAILR